jgi:hypothetical protein
VARALGEDHHGLAAEEQRLGGLDRLLVGLATPDGERAKAVEEPADQPVLEQLALRDEVDRPAQAATDHEGVEEAAVVRGEDDRALARDVMATQPAEPEVELDERLEHRAHRPVDGAVYPPLTGAPVVFEKPVLVCHGTLSRYPSPGASLR